MDKIILIFQHVVALLKELISLYTAPIFIRSDNVPVFIAQVLRE